MLWCRILELVRTHRAFGAAQPPAENPKGGEAAPLTISLLHQGYGRANKFFFDGKFFVLFKKESQLLGTTGKPVG
jgi:hypothetical protein